MKPSCGFPSLMKESVNLLSHNRELMAITAFLYIFLSSLSFYVHNFSTKSFIYDLLPKIKDITAASPGSPEFTNLLLGIKEDAGIFVGVELAFLLLFFSISVFSKTAIIFVSAFSYSGSNSLSLEELFSRVANSWTRPFITGLYVTLIKIGYMTCFVVPFVVPTMIFFDHHRIICMSILATVAVVTMVLYLYLSVVWVMGTVVSVIEESRGIEALGKARGIVNGMRLQGFALNLMINVLLLVLSGVPNLIRTKLDVNPMVLGLVQLFFVCLVRMFQFMGYTVLYFRCKKNHKMQAFMEYFEVPSHDQFFV